MLVGTAALDVAAASLSAALSVALSVSLADVAAAVADAEAEVSVVSALAVAGEPFDVVAAPVAVAEGMVTMSERLSVKLA